MKKHLNKIKSKPKNVREQYMWGYIIVFMFIVVGIWVLNLNSRLKKDVLVEKNQDDIKPFDIIKSGYEGVTASVGNIKRDKEERIIDLILVDEE
ncbi:MAG: hypothetical protein U9R00_00555 [Patescibacteria group bacterium]|nr:hypothetical protein [Patescibacteria group bacterium]